MKGDSMADQPVGCARTAGAAVGEKPTGAPKEMTEPRKEMMIMTARVGQKAPDFAAPTCYQGTFTTVKLSDYLG
jgi:peroxiredoxin (alkyl hydroperoxide reductase subunit C)